MARALIGTSGWVYPHWREIFYPPGLLSEDRLRYLATRFPTVEVNGSFYRLLRPSWIEPWLEAVPPGFVFAIKGSRFLTHMLKLTRPRIALANFFAQGLLSFGTQLGPILWQLPEVLAFDAERARAFFGALPRDLAAAERVARRHDHRLKERAVLTARSGRTRPIRYALEVRHDSWLSDEAIALLIEHEISLVIADTAGRFPFTLTRTAPFRYLRLHGARRLYGSSYTARELDFWADRVRELTSDGDDAFVYFDNDNKAYAPGNALALLMRLTDGARVRAPDEARPYRGHELSSPA